MFVFFYEGGGGGQAQTQPNLESVITGDRLSNADRMATGACKDWLAVKLEPRHQIGTMVIQMKRICVQIVYTPLPIVSWKQLPVSLMVASSKSWGAVNISTSFV